MLWTLRRLVSILLAVTALAHGSGVLAHAHRDAHHHAHECSQAGVGDPGDPGTGQQIQPAGGQLADAYEHCCIVCLTLAAPLASSSTEPHDLLPRGSVPASTSPQARPVPGRTLLRIACRGPPPWPVPA